MRFATQVSLAVITTTMLGCAPAPEPPEPVRQAQFIAHEVKEVSPVTILQIAELASRASGYYGQAKQAFQTLQALGQAFGLLAATDGKRELENLKTRLDAVAQHLDWRIAIGERSRRYAMGFGAAQTIVQARSLGMTPNLSWAAFLDSAESVIEAERPENFERFHVESATDGTWKSIIRARPTITDNRIYDWRLGVPALMQLISLRLQVLAGVSPDFRTHTAFTTELRRMAGVLAHHETKMRTAISCHYRLQNNATQIVIACADVNTGLSAISAPVANVSNARADVERAMRREVERRMPLFEMEALRNTLGLYADPTLPELTEARREIAYADGPSFCLDIQWNSSAYGTPVWLWSCDGGPAQQWIYDRKSGEVRNPVHNVCLDVQWGGLQPHTPVWTWECTGDDAQRWTWDPAFKILTNALGTRLNFQGEPYAGNPVEADGAYRRWTTLP